MRRAVYNMKELAVIIPQLENKRYEVVTNDTLTYVLAMVDVWAKHNNLILFQIIQFPNAGTFFIFNEKYPRWAAIKRWWSNRVDGLIRWLVS